MAALAQSHGPRCGDWRYMIWLVVPEERIWRKTVKVSHTWLNTATV